MNPLVILFPLNLSLAFSESIVRVYIFFAVLIYFRSITDALNMDFSFEL
jgi:hypothetical protein